MIVSVSAATVVSWNTVTDRGGDRQAVLCVRALQHSPPAISGTEPECNLHRHRWGVENQRGPNIVSE